MPTVESSILVKGPKEEAYRIARNMEDYPRFMENVKQVKVVQREGNWTVTDWVTNVDGRIIKWQEKDIFNEERPHIEYRQVAGDLKKFEGEWRFEEVAEGTVITLTVDFELGIPMLSGLLNPILKKKTLQNCEAMLTAIKEQVELAG